MCGVKCSSWPVCVCVCAHLCVGAARLRVCAQLSLCVLCQARAVRGMQ